MIQGTLTASRQGNPKAAAECPSLCFCFFNSVLFCGRDALSILKKK